MSIIQHEAETNIKANIDAKKVGGGDLGPKSPLYRCAIRLWPALTPEHQIHRPPFILSTTIKSINCHDKPSVLCIRDAANCLGM